jgi:predicted DNA-binding protein (MmcQ/YjbR family)
MSTVNTFIRLCLSLEEVSQDKHFDKIAFKFKKKIFATLNSVENRSTLKFLPEEQSMLCKVNPEAIYPVPNKWGTHGWTHVMYEQITEEVLYELLKTAYLSVRPGYDFKEED